MLKDTGGESGGRGIAMPETDRRTVDQKLIDANFFSDQEAVYELFTKMRRDDPRPLDRARRWRRLLVGLQARGMPSGTRRCGALQHRNDRADAAVRRRARHRVSEGFRRRREHPDDRPATAHESAGGLRGAVQTESYAGLHRSLQPKSSGASSTTCRLRASAISSPISVPGFRWP